MIWYESSCAPLQSMTTALCPALTSPRRETNASKTKAFQTAEAMLALVLPSGFPSSVRHPYRTYAGWQFTAMTASAAAGVMSTQALVRHDSSCWAPFCCCYLDGDVGVVVLASVFAP